MQFYKINSTINIENDNLLKKPCEETGVFEDHLHKACAKLQSKFVLHVLKGQRGDSNPPANYFKCSDPNNLVITVFYNGSDKPVELQFMQMCSLPRKLMQVTCCLIPAYRTLNKVTIRKCLMESSVIYELSKVLALSTLTEICLDDTWLPEANYSILLNCKSNLQNLSLSRCKLNDKVCEEIASKLAFGAPAENNLLVLNMASNLITDIGAKHVGQALRSNRCLLYLNLADNQISDEGAASILEPLGSFPLTQDEIMDYKRRNIKYLKNKDDLYKMYLETGDLSDISDKKKDRRKHRNRSDVNSLNMLQEKALLMASESLGSFRHPFAPDSIFKVSGWINCLGNMVLSYLNLGYNRISYHTVKQMVSVVRHQNSVKATGTGLIKAVIEGNNIPDCVELSSLNELFAISFNKLGNKERRKSSRSIVAPRMTRKRMKS